MRLFGRCFDVDHGQRAGKPRGHPPVAIAEQFHRRGDEDHADDCGVDEDGDSEAGARSLGVASYRVRFVVFVVAAAVTGAAGAVWYLFKLRVAPDTAFGVADWTAPIVVMVVIGGTGSRWGAMIGGLVYTYLNHRLTDLAASSEVASLPKVLRTPLQEPLFIL